MALAGLSGGNVGMAGKCVASMGFWRHSAPVARAMVHDVAVTECSAGRFAARLLPRSGPLVAGTRAIASNCKVLSESRQGAAGGQPVGLNSSRWRRDARRAAVPGGARLAPAPQRAPQGARWNSVALGQTFDVGTLKATVRGEEQLGTKAARRARQEGLLPGILYGPDETGRDVKVPLFLSMDDVRREVNARGSSLENTLFDLEVEGEGTVRVLPKQLQVHPSECAAAPARGLLCAAVSPRCPRGRPPRPPLRSEFEVPD